MGDAHVGHVACNYPAIERVRDYVAEASEQRSMIWMGDMGETVLANSGPKGALWDQDKSPDEQEDWLRDTFCEAPPKLVMPGNHEDRLFNETKRDPMKRLAKDFGCLYTADGGYFEIKFGHFVYDVWIAHGKGSSQRPGFHLDKVIEKMGVLADIVAIGHIHQLYHQLYIRNLKNGPYAINGIRTGGFLNPTARYTRKAMFPLASIGCPIVTLNRLKKKVSVDITTGVP
jgi:hypothetical protein